MKALTCSARDYVESKGRKLDDYVLESVSTKGTSFKQSCDPSDFPFVKNYEALTDLKFRIIDEGLPTVEYYSSATGLKLKK